MADDVDSKPKHNWIAYPPRKRRKYGVKPKMRATVRNEEPACRLCGAPTEEIDHIVPKCLGGGDERSNLQGICKPCHLTKSAGEANFMRWHVYRPKKRAEGNG
ncbi:HNH endonuclease [Sphingomicrobium marinum]|uniref:HNH endonuclease n=1 Tax=Sphingomicrobium marinum TaxID=1227950 RepID=UPI00223F3720|nr:HNH endonuclease signature motif containing protein [Sphingomicrobium marinum]